MSTRSWRQARFMLFAGVLVVPPTLAQSDESIERIVWRKIPMAITLPVGHERRVQFPVPVRVGIPNRIADQLRTQSVDGTVYWLAHAPFATSRVQVRELDSGRTYLVDLTASEDGGRTTPIAVQVPTQLATSSLPPDRDELQTSFALGPPDYVTLTRYAAQQLYAPERLLQEIDLRMPGMHRVPVSWEAVPLYRGGDVAAVPVAAWSHGGLHVTAVKLTNRGNAVILLDASALRGAWLAATFQHPTLHQAGDEADVTSVYLVSVRPFEESL